LDTSIAWRSESVDENLLAQAICFRRLSFRV
jgi:hypothetical protein